MAPPPVLLMVGLAVGLGLFVYYCVVSDWETPQAHGSSRGSSTITVDPPPRTRSPFRRTRRNNNRSRRRGTISSGDCTICQEGIGGHPSILDCGHAFHTYCITKWAQLRPVCPNCRELIS